MAHAAPSGEMTPARFVEKWRPVQLAERAASQEHFIDICRLLGQPTPAEHDKTGAEYTFEKGVTVTDSASTGSKGQRGFADVWWRGKFGWEYKTKDKHKSLADAYRQLCQYREALANPPLLIVCDISRIEIHTNFTGTVKQIHTITLDEIPDRIDLLRRVFTDPESFRPTITPEGITEQVAQDIGKLAQSLRDRGHDPHDSAHFLMKCMFCLFAEDVGLLPPELFKRTLSLWKEQPDRLVDVLHDLFTKMATGGAFGADRIDWFNGGLFDKDNPPPPQLTAPEVGVLILAAKQDWANVEPAIFGTLFERSLDPDKRAQIGAHYTSRDDILLVVEPVVMAPLRRRWEEIQADVDKQLGRRRAAKTKQTRSRAEKAIAKLLQDFMGHLASIRILDPACGSGNFLYVAIQQLLDLEKQVITYAARPDIALGLLPTVRPTQLHGIEINPYAAELAQVVIWIGYLQWMRDNGFNVPRDPILEPLRTIENRDAILDVSVPEEPLPSMWPKADFIIGNPPFLGSKLFRKHELDESYIQAMYATYGIANTSDLCCYWFERARQQIEDQRHTRAGLLATQGIRGPFSRGVLERIKRTGDIFLAWSDRNWYLDGAAVHVSIIGFDDGSERCRTCDGQAVSGINTDLTTGLDLTEAKQLPENRRLAFMGDTKGGAFDIVHTEARRLLGTPNPNGSPTSDVVRPWVNGDDITGRPRGMWIIDFATERSIKAASGYEQPFEYVERNVKAERLENERASYAKYWWIHAEARSAMRRALPQSGFIGTPNLTKFRFFSIHERYYLPDHQLIVFARSDTYFFGVLQSSVHELWSLRQGSQLEDRPRYTPTTCFDTFPLPWPPGQEPADHPAWQCIGDAAKQLNEQRERWLNPPEWIEPLAKTVDALDDFADVPPEARPLVRQSAIMALAAKDPRLKKRTLTNLYNERPTWLQLAHEKVDRAVLAAYAATDPGGAWQEDWAEVWRDTGAGQPLPEDHPLAAKRAEVDQHVLANLLRLNQART